MKKVTQSHKTHTQTSITGDCFPTFAKFTITIYLNYEISSSNALG